MDDQNKDSVFKTKNITSNSMISWVISVPLLLIGAGVIFSDFISGLMMLLAGVIILPPANKYMREKYNFSLSRKKKIITVVVLLIISAFAINKKEPIPTVNNNSGTQTPTPVATIPSVPLTLEQQITNKINEVVGASTNTGKARVVGVEVTKYSANELKEYEYKSTDTVKSLLITINASENLTSNLQKGSMDGEAAKIFESIFPLSSEIGDIIIWSQLPIQDKYGNTKDGTAITFSMGRPLYEKVNWANLDHRDLPNLLNSETRTDDRNVSRELIKF